MCGIVGFIGKTTHPAQKLLQALYQLEYRGYDSCGVALGQSQGAWCVEKSLLSVLRLQQAVEERHAAFAETSQIGLAHTRWATHGGATLENAHPHQVERICGVHNGIIDNEHALKNALPEMYQAQLKSETDTEVVLAHVAWKRAQGSTMKQALQEVMGMLRGSFAFVCADMQDPARLWCFASGSPLVLGRTGWGWMLASDALALAKTCDEVAHVPELSVIALGLKMEGFLLPDGPWAWQSTAGLSGEVVPLESGKSHTYQEIFQQPQVIRRLFAAWALTPALAENRAVKMLQECSEVLLLGCGSSYYAASVVAMWIERGLGILARCQLASSYRQMPQVLRPNTLVVTFSQSGETMDTLLALKHIQEKNIEGVKTLAVVNRVHASLARLSDALLDCRAGCEVGVATTKAFTAQLSVCWCWVRGALALGNADGQRKSVLDMWHIGGECFLDAVKEALSLDDLIAKVAQTLKNESSMYFLAKADGAPVAFEGALKMKELAYIHAEATQSAELKHGPLALVTEGFACVMLVQGGEGIEKTIASSREITSRGARLILIGAESATNQVLAALPRAAKKAAYTLSTTHPLPGDSHVLFASVCLQLLAYHSAIWRGCTVDRPRNLAKCVTVE